jgi:hypothetical protein
MNQSSQSKHHLLAAVAEANINKRTIPACFIEEVRKKSGIPERTFVWIGRYRRMSKGYEHRVTPILERPATAFDDAKLVPSALDCSRSFF